MKNPIKSILLTGATLTALFGCALKPQGPDARIDGAPLQPASQVARLALHTSRTYPGKPLNSWWGADILTIDGQPVPKDTAIVQMAPGKHTFKYACRFNYGVDIAAGVVHQENTTSADFEAGKLYFGYVDGKPLVIPQTDPYHRLTGFISENRCGIDAFNTVNPYWLV